MNCSGVYVADCKLITTDLVRLMTTPDKTIFFVSRCPSNFQNKLENRMIEKALLENQWTSLGQYGQNKKNACDYCLASVIYLKNDVRVQSMLMLLSVSLLIHGLY